MCVCVCVCVCDVCVKISCIHCTCACVLFVEWGYITVTHTQLATHSQFLSAMYIAVLSQSTLVRDKIGTRLTNNHKLMSSAKRVHSLPTRCPTSSKPTINMYSLPVTDEGEAGAVQ